MADTALRSSDEQPNLEIIGTIEELRKLERQWDALFDRLTYVSIFNTWQWIFSWWEAYRSQRQLLVFVWKNEGDNEIRAIMPMYVTSENILPGVHANVLRFLGDGTFDSDYLNILCEPNDTATFMSAVLNYLSRKSDWDICVFNTLPEHSLLEQYVSTAAKEANFELLVRSSPCSSVNLPESFEAFIQERKPRFRTKIRSLTKNFEADDSLVFDVHSNFLPDEKLRSLFNLHQQRWQSQGQAGVFVEGEKREFYRLFVAKFANKGWLRFFTLKKGDKFVAHQICFGHNGDIMLLQEGYDVTDYKAAFGQMLRALVFRYLISCRNCKYDFLGGASRNKTDWGAEISSIRCITLSNSGWKAYLYTRLPMWRTKLGDYYRKLFRETTVGGGKQ